VRAATQTSLYNCQVEAAPVNYSDPPPVSSLRAFAGEDADLPFRVRRQQTALRADLCAQQAAAEELAAIEAALVASRHSALSAALFLSAEASRAADAEQKQKRVDTAVVNRTAASQGTIHRTSSEAADRFAPMTALIVDDGPVAGSHRTAFRGWTAKERLRLSSEQADQRAAAVAAAATAAKTERQEAVTQAMLLRAAFASAAEQAQIEQSQRLAFAADLREQHIQQSRDAAACDTVSAAGPRRGCGW
jgi:hypothetical protein